MAFMYTFGNINHLDSFKKTLNPNDSIISIDTPGNSRLEPKNGPLQEEMLPGKGTSEGPISPIENDCHFDGHVHQEGMLQVERQFPLMMCLCFKSDPVSIHDNVVGKQRSHRASSTHHFVYAK